MDQKANQKFEAAMKKGVTAFKSDLKKFSSVQSSP